LESQHSIAAPIPTDLRNGAVQIDFLKEAVTDLDREIRYKESIDSSIQYFIAVIFGIISAMFFFAQRAILKINEVHEASLFLWIIVIKTFLLVNLMRHVLECYVGPIYNLPKDSETWQRYHAALKDCPNSTLEADKIYLEERAKRFAESSKKCQDENIRRTNHRYRAWQNLVYLTLLIIGFAVVDLADLLYIAARTHGFRIF
jgi:hypothetical protein